MKTREQIINSMCRTMRHDYGMLITECDQLEMPFMSGMTVKEQHALWNQMAQLFDNDISPYMDLKT